MYDVALSVLACLRAGTDIHIAWIASDQRPDGSETLALTPGGGQIGSLMDGILNETITHAIASMGDAGRIADVSLGPAEALISGLPEGSELEIAIVPGAAVATDVWESLANREPVTIVFRRDGEKITHAERAADGTAPETSDTVLICRYQPEPRMLIVGAGPITDALEEGFELAGWRSTVVSAPGEASGIATTLSRIDGVVVMGHDVEISGRALQAAIESNAGYIGSLGSRRMQELRQEWLAYRGVDWDQRIRGPAGLPIGASTPGEIAISIVAEAIAAAHFGELSDE